MEHYSWREPVRGYHRESLFSRNRHSASVQSLLPGVLTPTRVVIPSHFEYSFFLKLVTFFYGCLLFSRQTGGLLCKMFRMTIITGNTFFTPSRTPPAGPKKISLWFQPAKKPGVVICPYLPGPGKKPGRHGVSDDLYRHCPKAAPTKR